jgi:hypothetical protein
VSREAQARENDVLVNVGKAVDRLEFHDDSTLNEQVNSISAGEFHIFVGNRDRLLPFNVQVSKGKFSGKANSERAEDTE